jgi:hypothetical protein
LDRFTLRELIKLRIRQLTVDETPCLLQEKPFERAPAQAENRPEDELFRQTRSSDPLSPLAR